MFVAAAAVIVVWMLSGSFLGYSDTWQLIINTLTTLITFLMVFIIQNTQNRGTAAIHPKLDTLMRRLGVQDADLYDAENRSEAEAEAEAEDQRIVPPGARRPRPTASPDRAAGAVLDSHKRFPHHGIISLPAPTGTATVSSPRSACRTRGGADAAGHPGGGT